MRAPVVVLLAVASATSGAALVACIDLFHSTSDVLTACQRDAETPGCAKEAGLEGGADAGTDFCAWSDTVARQNATHACAWLGACESPLGRNAFGSCMFEALLAYDCAANPDHPVKGKAHALWDRLWQANSCEAVNAAVFPQGPQRCAGGPFVTCATQGGGPPNGDVRVECAAAGAAPNGENCALWGQTCGGDLSIGVCGGSPGEDGIDCMQSSCVGTTLHVCDGAGRDIGIDCASNGAEACVGLPPGQMPASWVACLPESDAGACTPDASAQCSHGIATSCPAGVLETINCQTLLLNVNACTSGALSPPFDWTSPCVLTTDDGGSDDASSCSADSCDGSTLSSCYRGAPFGLDCAEAGLGACQMRTTDQGSERNAACDRPMP